jgi:pimeloyl-ACP methyl ester carboxylesterase
VRGRQTRRPAELWPAGDPAYRVRRIAVDGGAVRVVERGDPSAPAAVLVPGWACSAYALHANVPAVLAAGHRAILVELRGLGGSDRPLAPAVYRPGLALRVALAAPERVTRLVALDPAGIGHIPLAALGRLPGGSGVARVVARLPRAAHRAIASLGLRAIYGDPRRVREAYFTAQLAMLRGYDWRPLGGETLAALRVPTLLVRGTRDRLVLVRDLDALERALPPAARLLRVRGGGHAANLECPGAIAAELEAFLRAGGPPASP